MGPVLTIMLDPTKKVERISKDFGFGLNVDFYEFPGTFQPQDANPTEIALLENSKMLVYVMDLQVHIHILGLRHLIKSKIRRSHTRKH